MEDEIFSCLVVKHSWKGKYRRILSLREDHISTYNPATLELTNQWDYGEVTGLKPVGKPGLNGEFVLSIRRKSKNDSFKFSSEYRVDILTESMKYSKFFATPVTERQSQRFNATKIQWSGQPKSIILEILPGSIAQLDPMTGDCVAEYEYKMINSIRNVSDVSCGFLLSMGETERLHLFMCEEMENLLSSVTLLAVANVGVRLHRNQEAITLDCFTSTRIGRRICTDDHVTSIVEFNVMKVSKRDQEPVKRIFCLSEQCILERDLASYSIITIHTFNQIFMIVRSETDLQSFSIEYVSGQIRSYTSSDRDNLLAALLDGLRASGNQNAHVRTTTLKRGLRIVPLHSLPDEETESQLLKFIYLPPSEFLLGGLSVTAALERFNANVPYGGLVYSVTQEGIFSENKEKPIVNALLTLSDLNENLIDWEAYFHCLRRIFASKAGFQAFTGIPKFREKLGSRILVALKNNQANINYMAIEVLSSLVQPMHMGFDIRQEQMNKAAVLSSRPFLECLLDMMINHMAKRTGMLVICSMLDFLTYVLCLPYCETTMGDQFDAMLEMVAIRGQQFFQLFQSSSSTIVKGAGLLMRAIIEESDERTSSYMQSLSLSEGAFLHHLYTAIFTDSREIRMLRNRQISRHLVATWSAKNPEATDLLVRIFPRGLLAYLKSDAKVPETDLDLILLRNNLSLAEQAEDDQKPKNLLEDLQKRLGTAQKIVEKQLDSLLLHWKVKQRQESLQNKDLSSKPIVLRRRRERVKIVDNWKLFFYQFNKDHTKADLIWNHRTRDELRTAISSELRLFNSDKSLSSSQCDIAWNHQEFEVLYPSLSGEVKVAGYFLRMFLEESKTLDNSASTMIESPVDFFNSIYHQFLLSRATISISFVCLESMAVVYNKYHSILGPFTDAGHIVGLLAQSQSRYERDLLVIFLAALLEEPKNVKVVAQADGFRLLVELLCLAHLHSSRSLLPTQLNEIEDSTGSDRAKAPEWYYRTGKNQEERHGPFGFDDFRNLYQQGHLNPETSCWAAGIDDWRPLRQIPQLRWTLVASDSALLNESDLAVVILDALNRCCQLFPSRSGERVVRPVPLCMRIMSDPTNLPHIVQLFLTFESRIVERTASLLCHIVQDNPVLSRLYLTGLFYFSLMYPGSNIIPIAKLLHLTHNRQAWSSEDPLKSEVIRSSILCSILPDANVFYLTQWGPDRFAQVFLGEFDNPEVIWNAEMRRFMIERLACHISDFSVRLLSNISAVYQFCPLAPLDYPQLETELFVHIYYLRHLCDLERFPEWPIRDPIDFLKCCLKGWLEEVERKGPTLSVEEAKKLLGISAEQWELGGLSVARKAYFKAAQQFHPDKNPEGREIFESFNRAYEILSCQAGHKGLGPDAHNLLLYIKAQCVLYSRHSEALSPYKYAGYTQLIKTIQFEIADDKLFAKTFSPLEAAVELCFLTVQCSALNAEQLRREGGLEVLHTALSRCVDIVGISSKSSDRPVQVCLNICRCYATSALFKGCCDVLKGLKRLPADLCRLLHFPHLPRLNLAVCDCISSLSVNPDVQQNFYEVGVLWLVIPNLFLYDFTLLEGGVSRSDDCNQQEVINKQAEASLRVCCCLAGFDGSTPANPHVAKILKVLLNPYFSRLMTTENPTLSLKLLNVNSETPYAIWDNSCRAELIRLIELLRKKEIDETEICTFQYSSHKSELIVGEVQPIFVRIFNEQPAFPIEEPKEFCVDLLEFVCEQVRFILSSRALSSDLSESELSHERTNNLHAVLEALVNMLKNNQDLAVLSIGRFKEFFILLEAKISFQLVAKALEVLIFFVAKEEVIADVAAVGGIVSLLSLSFSNQYVTLAVLKIIAVLLSNGQIMKASLSSGAPIYLLHLFCNADQNEVRVTSATLLAKIMADRLTGPPTRLQLLNFVPPLFLDAMRDQPVVSVRMFDERIENPELIWDADIIRPRVKKAVLESADMFHRQQLADKSIQWKLQDNFRSVYELPQKDHLFIGGVFLHLYISNPSWRLRNPDGFMVELMERLTSEMRRDIVDENLIASLSTALLCFLENNPEKTNQLPSQGFLQHFCEAVGSKNTVVSKAAISALRLMAKNANCVEQLISLNCVPNLMSSLRNHPEFLHISCQTIRTIYEQLEPQLVAQALRHGLPRLLLEILNSSSYVGKNSASTKAEIVETLKLMSKDPIVGVEISSLLESESVWSEYKEQRHDLFIETIPSAVGITGGTNVAGYLTDSSSRNHLQTVLPPK